MQVGQADQGAALRGGEQPDAVFHQVGDGEQCLRGQAERGREKPQSPGKTHRQPIHEVTWCERNRWQTARGLEGAADSPESATPSLQPAANPTAVRDFPIALSKERIVLLIRFT